MSIKLAECCLLAQEGESALQPLCLQRLRDIKMCFSCNANSTVFVLLNAQCAEVMIGCAFIYLEKMAV